MKTATTKAKDVQIDVPRMTLARMQLTITGLSPLMTQRWSEKAIADIRTKQTTGQKADRVLKDPRECFQQAKYLDAKKRDCIKAIAIKKAIEQEASLLGYPAKTVKAAIFVEGDLLPITYSRVVQREDMVRLGGRTADIRYRPEYHDWSCKLLVSYDTAIFPTPEMVIKLIERAGTHIGIGEWRPQKSGQHGRFTAVER